jgi:IS1 family transposase
MALSPSTAQFLATSGKSGIAIRMTQEINQAQRTIHDKSHQIRLWRAVDRATNTPLAYTFGTREHKHMDGLLTLLRTCIQHCYGVF